MKEIFLYYYLRSIPTPRAPRGGKPPAFGKDPRSGLMPGDGSRAPFGCAHE